MKPDSSSFILHPSSFFIPDELLGGVPYRHMAPLAPYTTWRVGGPADYLIEPRSLEHIRVAWHFVRETGRPWNVIGCGSNLLVADEGVSGVVMRLAENYGAFHFDGDELVTQAGANLPRIARAAVERGLAGLEFAINIPGSVGGGIYMNAGCFGGCIADTLVAAELWSDSGEVVTRTPGELAMGYRSTALMQRPAIVLGARFRLKPADPRALRERTEALRQRRRLHQPPGSSAGSVFKNPAGEHSAGYLIEQAGAKGLRCGQAQISPHHANFLVNLGGASAGQIHRLILEVQQRVRDRFGIELIPEVRLLGHVQPSDDLPV